MRIHLARKRQSGSAVIVVITLVFVMELLILNNVRVLDHLGRELDLLDHKQQVNLHRSTLGR